MPVVDKISEGVKLGSKFVGLDAEQYGVMSGASQAAVSIPSLQPVPGGVIPVIPIGQPIAFALNKLEALPGELAKKQAELVTKLMQEYQKQVEKAEADREAAEEQLFNDLTEKQTEIKDEIIPDLEQQIADLTAEIAELEVQYQEEKTAYYNTIFSYAEKMKEADSKGLDEERDMWAEKISKLDTWLQIIIDIMVNIVNKKLDLKFLQIDLENYQELANIQIEKDWEEMVDISTDFEVAVPYYPDIPPYPTLPEIPTLPEEPAIVRTTRKQFAKWVATPTVPPWGLAIAAILLMLAEMVANTPQGAAQVESQADAMIIKAGGCV